MNIDFTAKELEVIQLIVPELTPEEACNKVLRDWFNANVQNLRTYIAPPTGVDDILSARTQIVDKVKKDKDGGIIEPK